MSETATGNALITPLGEHQKNIMEKLKLDWYFSTVFEKVVLIILTVLGIWKGFELLGGLF